MRTFLLCCCLLLSMRCFAQEADSVYTSVDTPAEFPGGQRQLMQWMRDNMTYPVINREELTGSAKMSFVVEKDGKLTNVRVYTSNPEFSRYLGGLILSMPKWKPAQHNGQPVRSAYNLPIHICF